VSALPVDDWMDGRMEEWNINFTGHGRKPLLQKIIYDTFKYNFFIKKHTDN
jgi:hypothetical protein